MTGERDGQQSNESQRRPRRTSVPCPHCGGRKSYSAGGNGDEKRIYRRRRCADCGGRFSAYEVSAADYKRLERLYSLDAERARLKAVVDAEWVKIRDEQARIQAMKDAFELIWHYVEEERTKAEDDRRWQRENPTEAIKAILAPRVFEYLNAWARREGKSLTELIAGQLALDAQIDIDCRRGEADDAELDRWLERLKESIPA